MITGHEFAGKVVAKGDGVTSVDIGDRVSGEGHLVCGQCRNCRAGKRHLCRKTINIGINVQGVFAEYLLAMPAVNVFKIPASISDDIASTFDPLGNAIHTALFLNLIGEVLITGAGPIGLMDVKIARFCGARRIVITDINEYRLQMAKDFSTTAALNVAPFNNQQDLVK